ncbi:MULTISPECIES: endonuclease domain-containing protein [unclassified Nocardioides]|uniref:endonuclease domain-containing protein n=1 Tax=unclassified Nocardioides TaxID=2615069 RepID=UPI0030157379
MAADDLDEHRPFTRAQLRKAGRDPEVLRRQEYVQVMRSAWVHRDGVDDDTRILAALLIHPTGAFASHFSAARLWGLPVPDHRFEHVTVRRRKDRRERPELKSHVTIRARRPASVRGIPTTDVVTTFIELAGWLSLVDLVVLGDAIVAAGHVSPSGLLRKCRASGDYYAKAAARAASYVRKGVDSPMETRLRMLIVLAGLPEPLVNVQVRDEVNTIKRRYDLCYPELKLVIEYEGRQHADDPQQWERDIERREELDDEDWRILLVTSKGVYREPERTLQRIRGLLAKRGMTDVPELDETWREHFV